MFHYDGSLKHRAAFRGLLSGIAVACLCVSGQVFAGRGLAPAPAEIQTIAMYSVPQGALLTETDDGSVFPQELAAALNGGAETFVDAFQVAAGRTRTEMYGMHPMLIMDAWRPVTVAAAHDDERRVALLVGNSEYKTQEDLNVDKDLDALGDALAALGFDVTVVSNIDADALQRELSGFVEEKEPAGVFFFFLSGYGASVGGVDYFMGVDASVQDDALADSVSYDSLYYIAKMGVAGGGSLITVYDASRDEHSFELTR